MKVLVFAAHPDDAETCVGGSIRRYADAGHAVHVVNLTNAGGPRVDCARRTDAILGCTHEFLEFADVGEAGLENPGSHLGIRFDPPHLAVVEAKLREHDPELVWAHWPVDTHPDHIAAGSLALRACDNRRLAGEGEPELWFFAPAYGYQAVCFKPDHYEDITAYVACKREAVGVYDEVVPILGCYGLEETAHKFHGYASGALYAEAFVKCHFRTGRARFDVVGEGLDV